MSTTTLGNTVIESIGVYLPPKVVSTAEVLRGCASEMTFPLERMTGIRARRMAGETEFSIDLARQAAERCFAMSRYQPEDIDLLVCSNISRCDGPHARFTFEPSTAVRLKADFGCVHALAFDISNACAGTFTAITVADALLKTGVCRRALLVSGEYITCLTRTAQREIEGVADPRLACLTLGDSGVAAILEPGREETVGFRALDLNTLGRFSDCCTAAASDRNHGAVMLTDALRLTAAMLTEGLPLAMGNLARQGWRPDDAQHIILHQTSRTTLLGGMRAINQSVGREVCHAGNLIENLADRGNTATNSYLLALYENMVSGRIGSGDTVLFGVTGSGLTVGSAVYTLDDLPERVCGRGGDYRSPRDGDAPVTAQAAQRARVQAITGICIAAAGTSRAVGEKDHIALRLAHAAAEQCLERWSRARAELPLLLYAGVYRDDFMCEPAMAALLTEALALAEGRPEAQQRGRLAFDVFNGSVGFLQACFVATQMMRARGLDCALIATAEIENNASVFPERRRGLAEMGSAVILQTDKRGGGFGPFLFRSFTEHIAAVSTHTDEEQGKSYLRISTAADLEERYLACIAQTVRELLAAEGIALERINLIFPPLISTSFILRLATTLGVERSRLVDVGEAMEGDAFTSSLPAAIEAARERGLINAGDLGLMIAVGSGIQVGCALYSFA